MNKQQLIIYSVFSIGIFIACVLFDYYHISPSLSFLLGGIVGVFWSSSKVHEKTLVTSSEGANP